MDREWRRVVYSADCDEDGNRPVCELDFGDCECPGPTMEGFEYLEVEGILWARPLPDNEDAEPWVQ